MKALVFLQQKKRTIKCNKQIFLQDLFQFKQDNMSVFYIYNKYKCQNICQWITQCHQEEIDICLQSLDNLSKISDIYAQFIYFQIVYGILASQISHKQGSIALSSFIQYQNQIYYANKDVYIQIVDILVKIHQNNQEFIINYFISTLERHQNKSDILFLYELYFNCLMSYELRCYKILKYFYNHDVEFNEMVSQQLENLANKLTFDEFLSLLQMIIDINQINYYTKNFAYQFITKIDDLGIEQCDQVRQLTDYYGEYLTNEDVQNLDNIYFETTITENEFIAQKLVVIIHRIFQL